METEVVDKVGGRRRAGEESVVAPLVRDFVAPQLVPNRVDAAEQPVVSLAAV